MGQFSDLFDEPSDKPRAVFNLRSATATPPDAAARDAALARRYGLPPAVVQQYRPDYEAKAKADDVSPLLDASPRLRGWLAASEQNATIAQDDVPTLGSIEGSLRAMRATGSYLFGFPGGERPTLLGDVQAAGLRVGVAGGGIGRAAFESVSPALDPVTGEQSNPLRAVARAFGESARLNDAAARRASPPTDSIVQGGVSSGVQSVVQQAPLMAGALAAGPLAPIVALLGMTGLTFGESFQQGREKGLRTEQAIPFAASQAAIEYATEKLPVSRLFGDLAKNATVRQMIVRQIGAELPGEQIATALQDLNEWAVLNPEKTFREYLAERPAAAAQTAIATVVGTGGNIVIAKAIDRAVTTAETRMQRAQAAEQDAEALRQLTELAASSKVLARDASTFERFVEDASADGPVTDVYVPAQVLAQSGIGDALAEVSPAVREQLGAALATGGDVRIPIAEFAARIAPSEFGQSLLEHLKTDPNGFTKAEAAEYMQTHQAELEREVERALAEREGDAAFKAQADEVKAQVRAQLDSAGRFTGAVNDAYATMVGNFFAVQAAKLGVSPTDLFARYPMRVQVQSVAAPQQFDQAGNGPVARIADLLRRFPSADPKGMPLADFAKWAKERRASREALATELEGQADGLMLPVRNGGQWGISQDTRPDGKGWRITRFDTDMAPLGHQVYPTAREALLDLIESADPARLATELNQAAVPDRASFDQGVETAAFREWFGESKVVDHAGKPLVVYHGTESSGFNTFDPDRAGQSGGGRKYRGFYFTNSRRGAETYSGTRNAAEVSDDPEFDSRYEGAPGNYAVYLALKNPYVIDFEGRDWSGQSEDGDFDPWFSMDEVERRARKDGHDGVIARNVKDEGPHGQGYHWDDTTYIAFDPTQIKSVDNRGTFDAADPNILNQAAPSLVVTHNLTADNLLHASKIGGLPVPSLAITRADAPLVNFGEITLVGDRNMADPKGYASTRVFGADIYSPRYPSVELDINRKALKALNERIKAATSEYDLGTFDGDSLARNAGDTLARDLGFRILFLRDNGIPPEVVRRESMAPARRERLEEFGLGPWLDVTNRFTLEDDPAFREAALEEIVSSYEAEGDKFDGLVKVLRTDEAAQRRAIRGLAAEIANAAEDRARFVVERYATERAIDSQIRDAGLEADFRRAVEDTIESITSAERIFQGFTNAGRRRYIPHTLDNVVKLLKQELRGGERFNYGVGSLRAKFTPQFRSIAQIRDNADRLVTAEEFDAIKTEIDQEFVDLAASINEAASLDTIVAILEDAPKMGVARAAKGYGFELDEETIAEANAFLEKLRNLPTAYFEAKILRAVSLSEFKAAVVPADVDPRALEALRAAGVTDVRTYRAGDDADRAAKVGELEGLFFQQRAAGNRGSFNPATNTITLLKNADLSTFLHEAGHFFLEVQFDIASRLAGQQRDGIALSQGEQEMVADAEALLRWFGVESLDEWYGLDFEEKRDYHERFARGFEAYLFEGKSPSIELNGLFQRFRAWLLNVYRELRNLNVDLNDEVRGVFDRMLATNDAIALAEQGRSMLPMFDSPEAGGMTVEEFAAYQALGTQATADAIEDLQARALRDLAWQRTARGREVKRLQKQVAEQRREMTMAVRAEVMAQPVYRAWTFLTGRLTDQDRAEMAPAAPAKSLPDTVDPTVDSLFVAIAKLGGLDRAQAESQWGYEKKGRSPVPVFGKPLLRREGGLPIDLMVERLAEFGYVEAGNARELEDRFDEELRGRPSYSNQVDPSIGQDIPANVEAMVFGRLSVGDMREMGMPDDVIARIEALKMTGKNGLHPDVVADLFGFTSGDEMLRALVAADPPREAVEGRVDQRMLEEYGELATPEGIERAADRAIHNDVRGRFLAAEANALAKAIGPREPAGTDARGRPRTAPIVPRAARELAAALVARLRIRDVRPGQYASAEVRAARAAQKASQSGDLALAAAEKRNQIINLYATRSAHDALDEVRKGREYLAKFSRDGVRKALDPDYVDQIDALLERFDLRPMSNRAADKRIAFAAWLESQREQGLEPDVSADMANEAFRKPFREMTVEEFRGLVETVQQIEHLGRLKNKLLTARDQRTYEAIRDGIASSIVENAGTRSAETRTPATWGGRVAQLGRRFVAAHLKVATLANVMDGGKDGGPMWEYFVRSANERADQETTMRAEATIALSKILAPVMDAGRMTTKKAFPSIGRSLTREQRIAIALNMGNAGNQQRLLGGEGWTEAQVAPVLESLTATEWQAVQAVWDHFETYRPMIGAKERRVYGKEPTWVDPAPLEVTTADGQTLTLRGGYYPIKYDPAASQRAEEQADAEDAKRMLQGAYTSATTRRSFTKTRAEEVTGRPLLYSLAGIYSGVNDVIHDLTWHEWLIDVNRLLRSKTIDSAIRNHYGPEVKDQIKTWVRDIAEGDRGAQGAGEAMLARLRQGVSAAGLGFNVMSAAIQITGFNQSIVRVGAGWIGRGVARYIANPVGSAREVVGKSEFMRNRTRTRFRELNELRNRVEGQTAPMRVMTEGAYWMMLRVQKMVDVPTWLGAYEKALAAGSDEDRAIALADQAVIDAQGGGQLKDLSSIERGSPAMKLFTVYYTFMNTTFNLAAGRVMRADTPAKKAKLAVDLLLLTTVPAVLGMALKSALTPGGDDEEDLEGLARKMVGENLSYLLGLMVVTREFGEVGKIVAGAEGVRSEYSGPAGLRFISDAYRLVSQAAQGEFDDAFRKAAINVVGDLTGLPAAQTNRTITGIKALAENETDNPAAIVFGYQR